MLDPTEVRTGNWVLRITGTHSNTKSFFEYKKIAQDEPYHAIAHACFPIRITSVILTACGFTRESEDWYINKDAEDAANGLPLLRYKHPDKSWYLGNSKIQQQPLYLHQLQNLFFDVCDKQLNIQLGHFQNAAIIGPIDFFVKPPRVYSLLSELL